MYAPRFEMALTLAGLRHADQVRKGTGAPYLVHLVHVAAIAARAGYDEDTQIVGLLHDVLEDTVSGPRDAEQLTVTLRQNFGDPVADAVLTLTEPKRDSHGNKVPWRRRKEKYLAQLESGSKMALRISAADKLHNLSTLAEELSEAQKHGRRHEVWARFSVQEADTLWFYKQVYDTLRRRLPEPIVDALGRQLTAMGTSD